MAKTGLLDELLASFATPKKFKAQSPEGQKYMEGLLAKTQQADLPASAQDIFNTNTFYHVGNPGDAYDLNAARVANSQAPVGMYTYADKAKSDTYLRDHSSWSDVPVSQHPIVTSGENVFVIGADKPTEGMRQSFIDAMERFDRKGNKYASLPEHEKGYWNEKINNFMRWGDPTGLPVSAKDMNKIFTDNGIDMLLRNGNEFVHLKPEQLRRTDAAFNPADFGKNGLNLSLGALGVGGLFGMQSQDAEAGQIKNLFHGTDAVYDKLKIGIPSKRYTSFTEDDVVSNGVFFTPSLEDAESYGRNVSEYAVDLGNQLINPKSIPLSSKSTQAEKDAVKKAWDDIEYILAPEIVDDQINVANGLDKVWVDEEGKWLDRAFGYDKLDWSYLDNPEVVRRMKERGYNSVAVDEPNDASGMSYFINDPEMAKKIQSGAVPTVATGLLGASALMGTDNAEAGYLPMAVQAAGQSDLSGVANPGREVGSALFGLDMLLPLIGEAFKPQMMGNAELTDEQRKRGYFKGFLD